MRSTLTNRPTRGRFRASSIRLPTYMEAMKPQNTSGCSLTSCGPGGMPWIKSADHAGSRRGQRAEGKIIAHRQDEHADEDKGGTADVILAQVHVSHAQTLPIWRTASSTRLASASQKALNSA